MGHAHSAHEQLTPPMGLVHMMAAASRGWFLLMLHLTHTPKRPISHTAHTPPRPTPPQRKAEKEGDKRGIRSRELDSRTFPFRSQLFRSLCVQNKCRPSAVNHPVAYTKGLQRTSKSQSNQEKMPLPRTHTLLRYPSIGFLRSTTLAAPAEAGATSFPVMSWLPAPAAEGAGGALATALLLRGEDRPLTDARLPPRHARDLRLNC